MSKEIRIELSEEDFEELKEIKDRLGTTWEGMLKRGNIREIERLGPKIAEELKRHKEAGEDE